jgi:hypothetical protein
MTISPVRVSGRDLRPHKAMVAPQLGGRTVLTRSPWEFVSLWLSREHRKDALFYWDQARRFADAATGMPVQSAPLLHYYSFMNAAKALLSAKNVVFRDSHGVSSHNLRSSLTNIDLSNEGVKIHQQGVVASLSAYLGDTEASTIHDLKTLLFNLPFVHRTYCLTYRSQSDLFLPLQNCRYVFDSQNRTVYLEASLSDDFAAPHYLRQLPPSFSPDPARHTDRRAIRSVEFASVARRTLPSAADRAAVLNLHRHVRRDLQYINATQTLWYLKGRVAGPSNLQRSPLTISIAAMHRLSELCRYRPMELASFLAGQRNWLLTEFVLMAPEQFLDGVASEMTGHQFLLPNVRPAT